MPAKPPLTYKASGVDIDAGHALVRSIESAVARTRRVEVLGNLGGFGGLFKVPAERYRRPVLVAGTDGVGTKIELAIRHDAHEAIGIDLVAMCVNDVIVVGAEPLFFLDYLVTPRLDVDIAARVITGIAKGCELAGAALIGGETAEHPGMHASIGYDLAGFCVGVVEEDQVLDGQAIKAGDSVIGLASTGPHSNGFSLIRRALEHTGADSKTEVGGRPLIEQLMTPTRVYADTILNLIREVPVKGISHITGGGLIENIPRVLPKGLGARLDSSSWPSHAVFDWLRDAGVAEAEMLRTFNCGIGMCVIVSPSMADETISILRNCGEKAWVIGHVERDGNKKGTGPLTASAPFTIVILSSGEGTNLQNLIDFGAQSNDRIRISAVFSDQRSRSLQRAQRAGIAAHRLAATDFPNRAGFDAALADGIGAHRPDLIVLSGFMRILSAAFVSRFNGRIVNIHPSLLPRYTGLHTHRRVLDAGDAIHGATVHFVTEELDAGPGIIQCRVPVCVGDDEASLAARVHEAEYRIFPRAVQWCAEGRIGFADGLAVFDGMPMVGPVVVQYEV